MSSPGQFALDLTRLVEKRKVDIDTIVKRFTFGMFSRVIMRSPVDTGRFRANWTLAFGAPDWSSLSEHQDQGAVTQDGSGGSFTKTRVRDGIFNNDWVGGKIYLTNNVGYGYFLEYGTDSSGGQPISKQAPRGMIRLTVNEYASVLGQSLPYRSVGA